MDKSDLIGSVEAASILGVPRVTFNRWARAGDVRSVFKNAGSSGMRLFSRADIERLAESRKNQEPATLPIEHVDVA